MVVAFRLLNKVISNSILDLMKRSVTLMILNMVRQRMIGA